MSLTEGDRQISESIVQIRGDRVILDLHLAQMYDIETRALKQQVRRNLDRFPGDFMFELNETEIEVMVSQNVIPNKGILGGAKPMAFTEQGVAMLSSVLRSKKAVEVNIAIMRTFVHFRRILQDNKELAKRVHELEKRYDEQFQTLFNLIKELVNKRKTVRRPIGYKASTKK